MTALYVPPTDESDHKKQNQSLQLIGGIVGANTSAWTAYTPVVTASSGTFTTVSAAGRYLQIGKTVFLSVTITITTNGTAASAVVATLPFTASAGKFVLAGRDDGVSGKMLQGVIRASSANLVALNYDNTYPGANSAVLMISGVYESV